MRNVLLAVPVMLAIVPLGCSESAPTQTLPGDTLDHDAAPAFDGRWYGTATLQAAGNTEDAQVWVDVSAPGRNELAIPDLCGDGTGLSARVNSDSAFTIVAHRCPIPIDTCTLEWAIAGGSGTMANGTLHFTVSGTATGCGVSATLTLAFTGTRTASGTSGLRRSQAAMWPSSLVPALVLSARQHDPAAAD